LKQLQTIWTPVFTGVTTFYEFIIGSIMDDLKVAAVCMNARPGDIERNLDRIQAFVSEASAKGADIVCFPELSVTGYILNRPGEIYEGLNPSKITERLVYMARKAEIVLIAGLIEISGDDKPFITQVVAGPEGPLGIYRKTHLSPPEKDIYNSGEEIKVFSHCKATFGVQLCYEAHFPEISTVMSLMGADILFVCHASPRGNPAKKLRSWLRHLPGRAFDNGLFVVACNQVGKIREGLSFPGVALILAPDSQTLATYAGQEEKMIFADLEAKPLEEVRQHRMKYFLPQRRPHLYKKIVEA
jgi:predicted amidohydrolase